MREPVPTQPGDRTAATPPDAANPDALASLGGSVEAALSEALLAERERAAFLADSSRALAGSLNVDRLLIRVLSLAVPRLGTTAVVTGPGPRWRTWTADTATAPAEVEALPDIVPPDLPRLALDTGRTRHGDGGGTLAVPLVARGTPFGVLVVARETPYDDPDVVLVEDFAQRAALALDAARVFADRSHIARVLEANLRPPELPQIVGVRMATGYRSAADSDGLGGDFYDVHGGAGDWTVVVGDVCGKGVEAAVVTGRSRESIRTAAHVDRAPSAILRLLNETLLDVDDAPFVTLTCARLRPHGDGSVRVDVASAGHPPALVVRRSGEVESIEVDGMIAGTLPDARFGEAEVRLAPGELCLLYTDGVIEARRGRDEYGLARLVDTLATFGQTHPQAVVDVVLERVLAHLDGRPHDDIALLAFQADRA